MPGPVYSYVSLGTVKQQLANRLYDSSMTFWSPAELGLYLRESLRTWNAMTAYWRAEFLFGSQQNNAWYDLSNVSQMPNTLRPFTVLDTDIYTLLQYHLLEPGSPPLTIASKQFSPDDLVEAVQRRRDEILAVTGCTITRRLVPAQAGRTLLPDSVIDIRRVAYLPSSPPGPTYTQLASVPFIGPPQIPLAAPWVPVATGITIGGQHYGPAQQIANEATNTINSNGQADSTYGGVLFPSDQFAAVTIRAINVDGTAGVILRANFSTATTLAGINGYRCYLFPNGGGSTWVIDKIVSGVRTQLATGTVSQTLGAGDVIRGEAQGASIRIYYNGALLGLVIDSDIASGQAGFELGCEFSTNDATIGSWLGGQIATAAVYPPSPMYPEDTWAEQSFKPLYTTTPAGTPRSYIQTTQPPISFDTDRPPAFSGQYELLTIEAGAALDPAVPQIIPIPDDWTHLLVWGALADLLSRESNAKDLLRAEYCNQRYQMGLSLLSKAPALLAMRINNVPLQIDAITAADFYNVNWEGLTPGRSSVVYYAGLNLLAVAPPPDLGVSLYGVGLYGAGPYGFSTPYQFTATVAQNAPLPVNDLDPVQVSRDDLDALIDYAQHLASVKMGGAEFSSTMPLFERFLKQASRYSLKLSEIAEFTSKLYSLASRDDQMHPRYQPEPVSTDG